MPDKNLIGDLRLGVRYKSRCQSARVISEDWCARYLYCPCCDSDCLEQQPTNTKAVDFSCPTCESLFQLKSCQRMGARIVDAGYDSMMGAIASDSVPNLLIFEHSACWIVSNLVLIPSFFVTASVIERRPPLKVGARRAGWVGCNILLRSIPLEGKLWIVRDKSWQDPWLVRTSYRRVRPISGLSHEARGWSVDILRIVRRINRREFDLATVYGFESELQALHPENQHIRQKIRQQLQVLRNMGLLRFLGRGRYSMVV